MAPPGNQAVNGENKHHPGASGETSLLDSKESHQGLETLKSTLGN